MKRIILITLLAASFIGCSRYQPTIQQGNALEAISVEQIKLGMSKANVIQTLGSPLMRDDFSSNRWDYLYYIVEKGRRSEQKNLTLYFNNDVVSKIK